MPDRIPHDVTRTTLAVLCIGVLIAATLWTVRPFLVSFIWATMIVVATWPLLLAVQQRLGGKRWAAVVVMLTFILLVLFLPLSIAIVTVVTHSEEIAAQAQVLATLSIPPPPAWIEALPLLGSRLAARWQEVASLRPEEITAYLEPYMGEAAEWALAQAGSLGRMLLRFFLTVIITGILYAKGETVGAGCLRFAGRLAGAQGREAAVLAAKSVRAVALGVILTGCIQATVGGIGLLVVGVPGALLLTGIMFVLCLAQLGPSFVLFPAVAWVYWTGEIGRGTVLLVWAIFASTFDNLLRPVLIRRGANLPLSLIFPGVVGGLFAFGFLGLFLGPVVLVVTYTLLAAWVRGQERGLAAGEGDASPPAQPRPTDVAD